MKNKTLGDFCTLLVTFVTLLVFSVSFANAEDSPSYSNDFDAYENDTVDLEDGTTITGAAARILDGRLQLTRDGKGLGFSSFTIPAMEGTSKGFTIKFDYELFDSEGANDPADGFSINYGNAPAGDQGQAEEGMAGRPGVTENFHSKLIHGETETLNKVLTFQVLWMALMLGNLLSLTVSY